MAHRKNSFNKIWRKYDEYRGKTYVLSMQQHLQWVLISINITDVRDNIQTEICQYLDKKVNTLQLP